MVGRREPHQHCGESLRRHALALYLEQSFLLPLSSSSSPATSPLKLPQKSHGIVLACDDFSRFSKKRPSFNKTTPSEPMGWAFLQAFLIFLVELLSS